MYHFYFENGITSAFNQSPAFVHVCVFVHAHWGFPRLTKTAYPFRCQLFPLLPFIAHMLSAWSSRCYRIFRRRAAAATLSLGGGLVFKPTSTRLG